MGAMLSSCELSSLCCGSVYNCLLEAVGFRLIQSPRWGLSCGVNRGQRRDTDEFALFDGKLNDEEKIVCEVKANPCMERGTVCLLS